MHSPVLAKYFYMWNKKEMAISLGFGSLYNHSYTPNADYHHGRMRITYRRCATSPREKRSPSTTTATRPISRRSDSR